MLNKVFVFGLVVLSSGLSQGQIWRNSQIPTILNFGALDFESNLCADGDVPGCKAMFREMRVIEKNIRAREKALFRKKMSRNDATQFVNYKIRSAKEVIGFLIKHEDSARKSKQDDYAHLIGRLRDKIQIILTEVIQPKKTYIQAHEKIDDYNALLFGNPTEAEVHVSQKMYRAIHQVIVDPGIGTVRDVVEVAQESYKLYKKQNSFNEAYYPEKAKNQMMSYYRQGSKSWDAACWFCGRRHYVSAAHNMMNFGLLLGGGTKTRFKTATPAGFRGTASDSSP